jgi:glycosyltransferase involved in cell wall biosynthesis
MATNRTRIDTPGIGFGPRTSSRPIAFLVSTTEGARDIRSNLGSAAYSYHFVVEALGPVLENFGTWKLVDHPESRLAYAAARAEANGFRPVHLAVNPLQDVYLSPALPNVLFPFWEFPDVPDRDFGDDTRQNWARIIRPASLVLTACNFTAEAFRKGGARCPVAVVPIPLDPEAFNLPPWDPSHTWTLTCRHEVLGPGDAEGPVDGSRTGVSKTRPQPPGPTSRVDALGEPPHGLVWRVLRNGFRRVAPWMDPVTVGRLTRLKRSAVSAVRSAGRRPDRLLYVALRDGYRVFVRRWLSAEALERVSEAKAAALAVVGREPVVVPDPPLPSGALTLGGGLVYLTVFNIGDPRKNYLDILTAFLGAFRDRPDVTLAIKLVTNRLREHHESGLLREQYRRLGVRHRCRIVVITEFLSEMQMSELFRATTCYVNASHAEGACLPLMRALAGGRPSIAPDHTAMADYMDASVGFVVRSDIEPACWPHDPEKRLETSRYRLVWTSLRDAFLESARVAERDPARFAAMAAAARERMAAHASRTAAAVALREALELLPDVPAGALGWPGHDGPHSRAGQRRTLPPESARV